MAVLLKESMAIHLIVLSSSEKLRFVEDCQHVGKTFLKLIATL